MNENSIPNHIAIIPDGNRRWARARGFNPWEGHRAGADTMEKLIEKAHSLGVRYLSLWGSSEDNLTKRPLAERRALLDLYMKRFRAMLDNKSIYENKVKISILGAWREQFPSPLVKLLEECTEKTKHHSERFLNFLLAYNGTSEMLRAMRAIIKKGIAAEKITAEVIKEHLMTRDMPKVDYLIRTGGEPHLSAGFMMWDTADAQIYFTDALFPDFTPEALEEAIAEYGRRTRRFGG